MHNIVYDIGDWILFLNLFAELLLVMLHSRSTMPSVGCITSLTNTLMLVRKIAKIFSDFHCTVYYYLDLPHSTCYIIC